MTNKLTKFSLFDLIFGKDENLLDSLNEEMEYKLIRTSDGDKS